MCSLLTGNIPSTESCDFACIEIAPNLHPAEGHSMPAKSRIRLSEAPWRGTVSRLLSILRLHDFVEQDVDRKYRLGHAAGMLGKTFNVSRTARQLEIIHVHLLGLNRALGENVHFELLTGRSVIRAILVPGSKPVRCIRR